MPGKPEWPLRSLNGGKTEGQEESMAGSISMKELLEDWIERAYALMESEKVKDGKANLVLCGIPK